MSTPAQTTESIKESLAAVVGKKNVVDKPEILGANKGRQLRSVRCPRVDVFTAEQYQ